MMNCWKCGTELESPSTGKLAFRATCDACLAWLHCCKNCIHYKPRLPNDCDVPGTEQIADRETVNFCDEFELLGKAPENKKNANDISKKLFGDDNTKEKKSFGDLFND